MVLIMRVCVLGAGSWGTAIGKLLGEREEVVLWDIQEPLLETIAETGENKQYLPGQSLPANVTVEKKFSAAVKDSELLIVAVPSHAFASVIEKLEEEERDFDSVLVLSKGFDPETGKRLSEVYSRIFGSLDNYYLLTGPSHAREVARERPTTVTLGGADNAGRERMQSLLFRDYFRVYTNDDLIGLEMGGALKNIIALAAGVADGLGFGVNARAALITRGMNDLREVSEFEGAQRRTLYGLSGLGDLIVTATSELSRNYQCGQYLARGLSLQEAKSKIGQVVEGINATRLAMQRVRSGGLRAPLFKTVEAVLAGELSPSEAVKELMTRRAKAEFEDVD